MKNLGLRGKLFVLSGVLIGLCMLTGFLGHVITQNIVESYQKIDENNLPNVKTILSAQGENRSLRMYVYLLAVPGISEESRQRAYKRYTENWNEFDKLIKEYLALPFGPGEMELWNKLEPTIKTLREKTDKAISLSKDIKGDSDTERRKIMTDFIAKDLEPAVEPFRNAIGAIVKYHIEFAKMNSIEAHKTKDLGTKVLISVVVIATVIGLLLALFLSNSLVKIFKEISVSLTQAGVEVAQASDQVASSSLELSQAVHEQAASLQETAASLEELTSTIAKNSETSKSAADSAIKTQGSATHGQKVVSEMIKAMDEINVSNEQIAIQLNQSNQQIGDIVKVITEIGNKTKVINDIVFQTKLLSFNASVEAARAGENGKGFAVVAEEVGNLARMSGTAADEISKMLQESIRNVTSIVQTSQERVNHLMSEGKTKVERGAMVASECGEVFDIICKEINQVNQMSSEISIASDEQTKGVQEINSAVNMLDQATQQNSSVSQQTSAAAEQLSAQAASMKMMVMRLINTVEGSKENHNYDDQKTKTINDTDKKKQIAKTISNAIEVKTKVTTISKNTNRQEHLSQTTSSTSTSVPQHDDDRFEDVV